MSLGIGGRASHRLSAGISKANVIDHGYYLKPMTMNPYIGTVHDGSTQQYNKGFQKKHMHWLTRFRYNLLPLGKTTGLFSVNKLGKHVHYLEVSTIEKFKVQFYGEEARPMAHIAVFLILFSAWAGWRLVNTHPDNSYYQLTLWTTKPWVQQYRFAEKRKRINDPVHRHMVRCPEFYMEDPMRDLYALGVAANDPYLEYCKSKGVEKDLLVRKWGKLQHGNNIPLIVIDPDCVAPSAQAHKLIALK